MWLSIVFAPLVEMGAFLRVDQFVFPVMFLVSLFHLRRQETNSRGATLIVGFSVISMLLSGYGGLVTGELNFQFLLKWPALFLFNTLACYTVIWWSKDRRDILLQRSLRWLQIALFIAGFIGLIQVLEHHGLTRNHAVSYVLNQFYPYYGELTDNAHLKSMGMQLRTGGAGRITSVFDGHPILAGDFLAIGLVLTLPLARGLSGMLLTAVPTLALMLTLSRGSILAWGAGIVAYMGFLSMRRGSSPRTIRVVVQIACVVAGLVVVTMFTPFGTSILWRVESTIETIMGTGVEDGRTEKVWPMVFAALEKSSLSHWLFGLGRMYEGPADSQYLFTMVNAGLAGVFVLLIFHIQLARMGYRYGMVAQDGQHSEFGFAFAAAIVALLVMYTVHPALQNRRLLSAVFTMAMLIPHIVIRYRTRISAESSHDRQNRASHNRSSFRRRSHPAQGVQQPVAERV
ncbi:MAG: hypothetical protein ACKVT0_17605 [Planctomycetaceae bacterium]